MPAIGPWEIVGMLQAPHHATPESAAVEDLQIVVRDWRFCFWVCVRII